MNSRPARVVITPGEPAGIGPDIAIALASRAWPVEIVLMADPELLADRAGLLGAEVDIRRYDENAAPAPSPAGSLLVCAAATAAPVSPGKTDPANAAYVLDTLDRACSGCINGEFSALVTGPVNKSVIAGAGVPFSGHTEFLAERTGAPQPVMLLAAGDLRVALVTTHLALRDVPAQIRKPTLEHVLKVLHAGLRNLFGIDDPRIAVLGLNPHAGESGHLGTEERDVIEPVLEELRSAGMRLSGPLPADTAFTPPQLETTDAVLAMYHDQGLPVLKHAGFGRAVNVTLGLPIIRTSVDHGTALELAGTGRARPDSLFAALVLAIDILSRNT